ncbi:Uncharacterised protein [Bordetella pertussis]|nr:Uncharacterised protein [Bordetella pertussis]
MPNTATRGCTQASSFITTVHTPVKKPGRNSPSRISPRSSGGSTR